MANRSPPCEFTRPRTSHAHQAPSELFNNPAGPIDPAGRQFDISDRPLFCSSTNMRNEVVIGSSDHALYSIDVIDPKKVPITMYTKTCGHTDWVTSVTHMANGDVLSGAMDGKLCLWSAHNRRTCIDIARTSTHPISKIVSDLRYNTALACSYDGNIEVYQFNDSISFAPTPSATLSRRPSRSGLHSASSSSSSSTITSSMRISPQAILSGHEQPVLECTYSNHRMVSGDKSGMMIVWDLIQGIPLQRFRAHPAAITNLYCGEDCDFIITTGTDGYVKLWDPRSSAGSGLIQKVGAHVSYTPSMYGSHGAATNAPPARGGRSGGGVGGRTTANTTAGRGSRGRSNSSSSSNNNNVMSGNQPPAATPVAVMSPVFSRGSSSDLTYLVTGGGSAQDSRLCLLDVRMNCQMVGSWDHHRNGVYSLCIVGDETVLSGDGMGTLLSHHLLTAQLDNPRQCLKYGVGASAAGAVRAIHCLNRKVVTAGEDGKALVFDY